MRGAQLRHPICPPIYHKVNYNLVMLSLARAHARARIANMLEVNIYECEHHKTVCTVIHTAGLLALYVCVVRPQV